MAPELVLDRRGPSLVARLNRPEARNALTPGLIAGIGTAVAEAEADPAIRALILTGTGDRAFCAGMDLRAFAGGARFPDSQSSQDKEGADAYRRLLHGEVGVPVIGAANGTAVGGGFELLLACDIVLSCPAAAFGLPEVKRGLIAAGGGVITLGARVPLGIALEMTLTGDTIDAARACELGLVNAVVPTEELLGAAVAVAERIAANGPLAVAATKELVRMSAADAARAWARLGELQTVVFTSEDAKEGAMAFIEKRPPQWTGA
jgi:enoyl-CoA hydratase/carnithine racemase